MKHTKLILSKLLHPPKAVLCLLPVVAFTALIFIFVTDCEERAPAYPIYMMSAYALTILLAACPRWYQRIKAAVQSTKPVRKLMSNRYFSDVSFRGGFQIYQGMAVNFLYAVFRMITGIYYASVWMISMAVYHLMLGAMRAYLIIGYRRRSRGELADAYCCYRKIGWLLLLLNIPMGGMILLMIQTNSGFFYPGYIIYLSALYTFYSFGISISQLVQYRRLGNPILSAAKVLNFVSAMMSVLGLQTAMISRFSVNGEAYLRWMNAVTGGFVYGTVILLAGYMICRAAKERKRVISGEQV